MTNTDETLRQDVKKEAAEKRYGAQRHHPMLTAVGIVLVSKCDAFTVESHDSVIGNSDAVSVTPKIPEHLRRTTEGGFGINNPIVPMHAAKELRKLFGWGKRGGWSGQIQLAPPIQAFETGQKLAAKDTAEDLPREDEGVGWMQ